MGQKSLTPAMIVDVFTKERDGKENYTIVTLNIMGGQYRLLSEISEDELLKNNCLNVYGAAAVNTIEKNAVYNEFGRDITAIGEFPNKLLVFTPNSK